MVAVAQLVESRIVIPVVVGSSPISHPTEYAVKSKGYTLRLVAFFIFLEDHSRFLEDPSGIRNANQTPPCTQLELRFLFFVASD